jgi:hypothetical protein
LYGWPSTGGRHTLENSSALELDFLGVDRFVESEKAAKAEDEDAFCLKLRRLSGTFCEFSHGLKTGERLDNEVHSFLGWPDDGGVWLLELSREEAYDRKVGAFRLAKTMEERCHEIQMCGGTFYADPTECERTRDLAG